MKSDDCDTEIVKSQINFSPFYFDLNLCNASGFDATETQYTN